MDDMIETALLVAGRPDNAAMIAVKAALPTILAADKDDILGKLAAEISAFEPDVSTERGRKEIASMAHKVARTKMDLIRLGKSLTTDWRARVKAVNDECGVIEERMDALKRQVRAPLDEFEAREEARTQAHEAALAEIEILAGVFAEDTAAAIAERLAKVPAVGDRDWQEFHVRAMRAIDITKERLRAAHAAALQREAEAAELARLRAAEAERLRVEGHRAALAQISAIQIPPYGDPPSTAEVQELMMHLRHLPVRDWEEFADEADRTHAAVRERLEAAMKEAKQREDAARAEREQQIAAEAAERARQEAEARAERERQEAEAKAVRERQEAERREREAQEAARQAEADRKAILQRAEADRKAAEERAEADRLEAAQRAEREKQEAVETERRRQEAEAERQRQEEAKRAADLEHRRQINSQAVSDLVAAGVSQTAAVQAVRAVAQGKVRHITIRY